MIHGIFLHALKAKASSAELGIGLQGTISSCGLFSPSAQVLSLGYPGVIVDELRSAALLGGTPRSRLSVRRACIRESAEEQNTRDAVLYRFGPLDQRNTLRPVLCLLVLIGSDRTVNSEGVPCPPYIVRGAGLQIR